MSFLLLWIDINTQFNPICHTRLLASFECGQRVESVADEFGNSNLAQVYAKSNAILDQYVAEHLGTGGSRRLSSSSSTSTLTRSTRLELKALKSVESIDDGSMMGTLIAGDQLVGDFFLTFESDKMVLYQKTSDSDAYVRVVAFEDSLDIRLFYVDDGSHNSLHLTNFMPVDLSSSSSSSSPMYVKFNINHKSYFEVIAEFPTHDKRELFIQSLGAGVFRSQYEVCDYIEIETVFFVCVLLLLLLLT